MRFKSDLILVPKPTIKSGRLPPDCDPLTTLSFKCRQALGAKQQDSYTTWLVLWLDFFVIPIDTDQSFKLDQDRIIIAGTMSDDENNFEVDSDYVSVVFDQYDS